MDIAVLLVLEHEERTQRSGTRIWKENDRTKNGFFLDQCIMYYDCFFSFCLSAVVIPILDQERNKAITVLLVSHCIPGPTVRFQ